MARKMSKSREKICNICGEELMSINHRCNPLKDAVAQQGGKDGR